MTSYIQTVFIDGMKCTGCATTVRNTLETNKSLSVEKIDLKKGIVTFKTDSRLSLTLINQLLKDTKYTATKEFN
ncbi:heavy-metal-associated domain-containing protein [Enterococcus faecalis]|uniref:heavy-metal-associated domain-containing protein n=1 Tax=Enterococcus faecalis TaxID=1351 RepID=UPI0019E6E59B|nr:heavy-metal-associated domain-containing protein [Enterococcus faecalis]EGO9005213.1 heavy-metal-associated domain-containing protein [Enterococcus faecalis]EGO9160551.1 heavy-metal-associated domain-containing protein [Enterococcus faecalis]EHL2494799.1 heavy-metal-associated domain-containing protein [Enterococcus faecalis]EKJ3575752.1 heavy-metal-associated domain-containing protein [Enterococcus faecalis]